MFVFFFFKPKTAYEMRISDWSSDVCSSDLKALEHVGEHRKSAAVPAGHLAVADGVAEGLHRRHRAAVRQVDAPGTRRGQRRQRASPDERPGGKECVSKSRSLWTRYREHKKQKHNNYY